MATKLKPVDIVIVGAGWAGGIMAKELAGTGQKIVMLERGGPRDTNPDFMAPGIHDELRYSQRNALMQDVARDTITFRNAAAETALPMRQLGSFLPGEGVGGAGVHWNGQHWRWLPWDHEPLKQTVARYGKKVIPDDMLLQDWPIGYDELEPYYERFEYLCGVSGKAGNLKGQKIAGGNIFEGPRQKDYPNPPLIPGQAMVMFQQATAAMGYHPFMTPAANSSRNYTNPDGVAFGACHYCGFCERFGCEVNAKASPHFTVIPQALKHDNVELRTHARVLKVNLDKAGKRAVSVTYLDAQGHEIEQPAELILLTAYALNNVHLMLLSGIGKPYDPVKNQGTIGRAYSYQIGGGATAFFDENTVINPFMGAGALQMAMDDLNGDYADQPATGGFIGGSMINCTSTGGRPIGFHPVPHGTPRWGAEWKAAVARHYNHTVGIGGTGSVMSFRGNYLDLDPTYRNIYGQKLMRLTFDYHENELKKANAAADLSVKIAREMGAKTIGENRPGAHYTIVPYQSTHNTGGAIMGANPKTSAVNKYLQSWDVPNVFAIGASAYPQNAAKNPTGPLGALALWTAEAIREKYLKKPGALVSV